jgi:acetyl esterase/lipase
LHGSEGGSVGFNHIHCALFAAHGFAAMAQHYTENNEFMTSPDIHDVPLDCIEAALLSMKQQMQPFGCGVGLFGVSRGAELALLLGQLLAEDGAEALPDAIAAHSVPEQIWGAYIVENYRKGDYDGGETRPAWSWRGSHERTLPGKLLQPERYPNPVFIAHGMEDELWDVAAAKRLVARMQEAGHPPEAHFFDYEGHTFGPGRNRELELLVDFFSRNLSSNQ